MLNISDTITRLEKLITLQIPVTRHLHFRVLVDNNHLPVLEVPLQPNINHLGTAFGGSLSMLCTIEGWACMYLLLQQHELMADILIQKSEMNFLSQVEDDFKVTSIHPSQTELDVFIRTFHRFGKARIPIRCYVQEQNRSVTAARFTGSYAAVRP